MRDLIVLHPGGWRDDEALRRLKQLATAAADCTNDAEWKDSLDAIVNSAIDLYSEADHLKWAQGSTSGADVLRLRVLREVKALQDRLVALQAAGRPGAEAEPRLRKAT